METPFGDIPDRLARDMSPRDLHDYLKRHYGRRGVLKGAATLGAAAVAGPVLWRQRGRLAVPKIGPQWIAFGSDPGSQMYVSWSAGTASGASNPPPSPQVRWGLDSSYGSTAAANSGQVPIPAGVSGEPAENTFYNNLLLTGLTAGTTYHYSVSNDGTTWGPDTTFTTAAPGLGDFTFTAFGDEAASPARAQPMVQLAASFDPAFQLIAGDLAYATPYGERLPTLTGFKPSQWDKYLDMAGPAGAQSIPWMASVGAHETEPLDDDGYAGFVTRFPQNYDSSSGSPVVFTFTYGNVAVIHLDGNDLSAQEPVNNGYTEGAQTTWLSAQLSRYRAAGSGIDFIVVVVNCCCYSSNRKHGSDGGLRYVWGPLFDQYSVDLVISGHVHAYERTNPMINGARTKTVASGGTVHPATDGTTYICAGGGGNGLYKEWYGTTGSGDPGSGTRPKIWQWTGGESGSGGTGSPQDVPDPAKDYSAFRHAVWSCLVVDVTAPAGTGGQTSMYVQAMMPAQTSTAVTSIANPTLMDSVTLVRTSTA
jgi:Purple acid Phosphatase, N-terminal domain/Calcineurin-like phosphoesterase